MICINHTNFYEIFMPNEPYKLVDQPVQVSQSGESVTQVKPVTLLLQIAGRLGEPLPKPQRAQ